MGHILVRYIVSAREKVLGCLKRNGPSGPSALAHELDVSPSSVSRVLVDLYLMRKVQANGCGIYEAIG